MTQVLNSSLPQENMLAIRSETNKRDNNEDSFVVLSFHIGIDGPPITVLAVADGMGGYAHGEVISREALKKYTTTLFRNLAVDHCLNVISPRGLTAGAISEAVLAAIEETNSFVVNMISENGWGKAGSTIVTAVIWESWVIAMNLGDSPLFHYQPRTRAFTKITEDHSVAAALARAGVISPDMIQAHEGRSQLQYFLGGTAFPRNYEPIVFRLESDDVLLLCSDGICGKVSEQSLAEIVGQRNLHLGVIADRLVQASGETGETDNQTLILWRCTLAEPVISGAGQTMVLGSPRVEDDTE